MNEIRWLQVPRDYKGPVAINNSTPIQTMYALHIWDGVMWSPIKMGEDMQGPSIATELNNMLSKLLVNPTIVGKSNDFLFPALFVEDQGVRYKVSLVVQKDNNSLDN